MAAMSGRRFATPLKPPNDRGNNSYQAPTRARSRSTHRGIGSDAVRSGPISGPSLDSPLWVHPSTTMRWGPTRSGTTTASHSSLPSATSGAMSRAGDGRCPPARRCRAGPDRRAGRDRPEHHRARPATASPTMALAKRPAPGCGAGRPRSPGVPSPNSTLRRPEPRCWLRLVLAGTMTSGASASR